MTDATTDAAEEEDSDLGYIRRLALAEPDTTLGKLQRGRGAGWLECLELPRAEANDLLWHCIVFDPRVSQQGDSRGEYYASLGQRIGFDVSTLLPDRLPPEERWRDRRLIVEVLTELDRAGIEGAGIALLAQIVPEDTIHENLLIQISWASPATIAALPETLTARRDDENLIGTVNRFYRDFPWADWAAAHPRIASALHEVNRRRNLEPPRPQQSRPEVSAPLAELLEHRWNWRNPSPSLVERLTTGLRPGERDELIAACSERPDPRLAFTILGLTNDPAGLPAATIIADEPAPAPGSNDTSPYARQGAIYRYLRALGPEHTLPLARQWLGTSAGHDAYGCDILGLHAEPSDIPGVRARLSGAWTQRQIGRICDLLDALGRQPQLGPFPELHEIFEGIEYSHARWRAARVIAASDASFSTTLARECLWDSSEGVRDVAIDSVAIRDEVAAARRDELVVHRSERLAAT